MVKLLVSKVMEELRALALVVDGHRGGSALLNLMVQLGAAEPMTELGAAW